MTRRLLTVSRFALAAAAGTMCLFVSDTTSSTQQSSLITQADARIGRPGTPLSVAGVARRQTRRAYYGGAAAIGAGAYYGGSSYYGGGGYYATPPGGYYGSGDYVSGSYPGSYYGSYPGRYSGGPKSSYAINQGSTSGCWRDLDAGSGRPYGYMGSC